jgi:hypothetical protein
LFYDRKRATRRIIMPYALETLENWLNRRWIFANTATTVAATLFTWNAEAPPQPPDYAYYGWASPATIKIPTTGEEVSGLTVTAALQLAPYQPTYFFITGMYGDADGNVFLVNGSPAVGGPSLTSPDYPAGSLGPVPAGSGPYLLGTPPGTGITPGSSGDGEFIELDFTVTFTPTAENIFIGTETCHLLLQGSALYLGQPKSVKPIGPGR